MTSDLPKYAAGAAVMLGLMVCFGGCGGLLTWTLLGAGGSRDTGVRPVPAPRIEVTDPNTNPPRPVPPIRPGTVSAPDMVEPGLSQDQCTDMSDGGPVHGPGCVTAEIGCDQMVIGHTVGGVDQYDTRFYEKKFCWPATVDHDSGDERVYRLKMPPGDWRAWVTLHTPCADLDVAGIRWDDDSCPTMGSSINVCEMKPEKSTNTERIELTSQTFDGKIPSWYIVVEGKNDNEGPFSLHVQCAPGLGGDIKPRR